MAVSIALSLLGVIVVGVTSQDLGVGEPNPCDIDSLGKQCPLSQSSGEDGRFPCEGYFKYLACYRAWKEGCAGKDERVDKAIQKLEGELDSIRDQCIESGRSLGTPVPKSGHPLEKGLTSEPCPDGWFLSNVPPYTCLWMSNQTRCSPGDANKVCQEMDSGLMRMETEQKYDYFLSLIAEYNTEVWLGLTKSSETLQWHSKDGLTPASSLPNALEQTRSWRWKTRPGYCDHVGLAYNLAARPKLYMFTNCHGCEMKFFCEKPVQCKHGWFGPQCEKKVKCYGHDARFVAGEEVTCPYGCELGWAGQDCSRHIREPEMNYFCGSNPSGKEVVIWIDTKGSKYRSVQAVNELGTAAGWCMSGTKKEDEVTGALTLRYTLPDREDIQGGHCAWQILANGNYKMRLLFQKTHGIVSRYDKTFELQCNFSDANQYTLNQEVKIRNEKWFEGSSLSKPVESVKEKKERIDLNLVDPATGQRISGARIDQSVALRIRFGFGSGSVVTGVVPYSCHAYTTRGSKKELTDEHGCPVENSPMSAFYRNDSTSLLTRPFPMFALPGHKRVKFSCKYRMCFGNDDPCPVGCNKDE